LPATAVTATAERTLRTEDEGLRRTKVWQAVVLGVIVLVGALARAPGLGAHGLFYDDAWFALAARAEFSTALHMTVTTPGFTMLERVWIGLGPNSDTWAQLLPWILGVLAPVVAFALGRMLGITNYGSLFMAAVVAASPAAIEFSVRVKEYEADLVLAAVVLMLAEVARRSRTGRSLAAFGVVSILAVLMSASTAPVVVGSWAALAICALLDHRRVEAVLVGSVLVSALTAGIALVVTEPVPSLLNVFWRGAYRLLGSPFSWPRVRATLGLTGLGLPHGLVGTPVRIFVPPAVPSASLLDGLLLVVVAEVALFAWLAWPAVAAIVRRDASSRDLRFLPSVLTIGCAVILFLGGRDPLGTGRTDLVLYPAFLVLLATGVERVVEMLRPRMTRPIRRGAVVVVVVVASAIGLNLAWQDRAWYPSQDVAAMARKIHAVDRGADAFVVSYHNSFTWAYEGLSSWTVHFSKSDPAASTIGFWVTFPPGDVLTQLTAVDALGPIPGLASLPPSVKRLWSVGATDATAAPNDTRLSGPAANKAMDLPSPNYLRAYGWRPTSTRLLTQGVYAQLYVRT
jgi:hypothetical protein